jgi:uncharacterized protein YndB with AHSA1/START domain
MAEQHSAIRVSSRYSAPTARVFAAWLDPGIAGKWLFATASRPMARVNIDARAGGTFRFEDRQDGEVIEYTGKYREIVPCRRLVFTLSVHRQSADATRVIVDFVPSEGGCEITLTQERVSLDCASPTEARWTGILYGLGATLEANIDRRRKGPIRVGTRGTWRLSNSEPAKRL